MRHPSATASVFFPDLSNLLLCPYVNAKRLKSQFYRHPIKQIWSPDDKSKKKKVMKSTSKTSVKPVSLAKWHQTHWPKSIGFFRNPLSRWVNQLIRGRPTKVLKWLAISEASPMYRSQSITFVCHKVLFQATCFRETANYFMLVIFCALKFPWGKPTCCSEWSILRDGSTSGIVILHSIYSTSIYVLRKWELGMTSLIPQNSTKFYKSYSQTCEGIASQVWE